MVIYWFRRIIPLATTILIWFYLEDVRFAPGWWIYTGVGVEVSQPLIYSLSALVHAILIVMTGFSIMYLFSKNK